MEFKDYYATLGIARGATDDEVRKAYRKLARKYHPDVSKEADAQVRMRDLNEANDVLRDKEKRAAYDALADRVARGGSTGEGGNFQPPPGWDEGFEFHNSEGQGPADHAHFSDFFSSVFVKSTQRGKAGGTYRARGEDHHAAIEISVEDAIHGVQRDVALHKLYRIEGNDLYMTLPVTPTEAALDARRLERDFGVDLQAAALILDLQREVRRLKAALRVMNAQRPEHV